MKRLSLVLLTFLGICISSANSQERADYYSRNIFLMAPEGTFEEALLGFANPAALALLKSPEHRFYWSTDCLDAASFGDWGYFAAVPHLGFGVQRQSAAGYHVTDYRLSLGSGTPAAMLGLSYGWSSGYAEFMGHERMFTISALVRSCKYSSIGLIGNFSTESDWNEVVGEIGIRPLGTSRLLFFADGAVQHGMNFSDAPWSAGAAVEVIPGISLVGRYFESEAFTFGINIDFGHAGLSQQSHYDRNQKLSHYSYQVRLGGLRPSVFPTALGENKRYITINMKGIVDYQKYVLFDDQTLRFMDIMQNIKAAYDDPRVAAIVLNLSSLRILPEHAWEIREELQKARDMGKKIIVFIDEAAMTNYHLASVADKIVMDPEGSFRLGGYAFGKTYFKGTLEKLGLGFDEWRLFKYKSAVEIFSRENMSDADREQYQDFVDDLYTLVRDDVCRSRMISPEKFDNIIDNEGFIMPDVALANGLVDTLARWSDKDEILENLLGKKLREISPTALLNKALPQGNWGQNPQVAVVYGLGECSMDTGIKGRWLETVFLRLMKDRKVKAIVFRVDSPGGLALPSDLVAEAIRKCSLVKPVVISQGQVAGSGGYWISMYGNEILAGPNTVTGSIGVIGGWIYDKGLSAKIGMTSDFVKRGKHADLGMGITIPFLDVTVPARNLDDEERTRAEKIIGKFYDRFVEKVAAGRKMTTDEIRKIGEGHFYSGTDGKEIGLIDRIGNLMTALAVAEQRAGLKPDEEIEIIEVPKTKGFLKFGPKALPISTEITNSSIYKYVKMTSENPGKPLPMLIPGTYPELK